MGLSQPQTLHDLAELLAIFGAMDDLSIRANHLDAMLLQDSLVKQRACAVERGLSAECRQQRVDGSPQRLLFFDDLLHRFDGDRLDVGAITERGIGHDRRGIGVHQHHAIALFAQTLARLRARVIELATLSNDDGTRADDEDGVDVVAARHERRRSLKTVLWKDLLVNVRICEQPNQVIRFR